MAKSKRSQAQEKRLGKLREQDAKLRVVRTLDDGEGGEAGTVIFRFVQSWQNGWAKAVSSDTKAYTYAMDVSGKVYGYCYSKVPVGSGLSEHLTFPEKRRERTRAITTRKPASAKAKSTTTKAVASKPRGRGKRAEAVALPGAA